MRRLQWLVSYVQVQQRNGKRCSAEKAFLRPIKGRSNLRILTNSRAVKILINSDTGRAYGVQFAKNKQYHSAFARKEVIVSAGGLNSPQLLMLSGIGPKKHLEELEIPLLKDLPVGQMIYDHATFVGLTFTMNESISFNQDEVLSDIKTYMDFFKRRAGPFTTIGGVEALVFVKTNASRDPDPLYPDMELIFIGGSLASDKGTVYRNMFNIPKGLYDRVWKPLEKIPAYQVFPMLVHPKSHGYMRLKSKNPFKWPKFYANYFSDPENDDVKTFIASIREIQRINMSPSFQKYGATLWRTPIPGCENQIFDSDEYWECSLRTIIGSLHHQVASCKMGPSTDPQAVVDHQLKVHGIKNLRVADTSIIPFPLTVHTAAPSYMIGEKASDLIKREWNM
ncbi:hypothetical protein JTB14_030900 [Gonioctena quinquepunctata]|nr:hypothetical protein JTB14_030900 [Gonioctena quinquepunctata]